MNMIPERSPPTITTIAMFNLSCTVYNFFLGAFINVPERVKKRFHDYHLMTFSVFGL